MIQNYKGYTADLSELPGDRQAHYSIKDPSGDIVGEGDVECGSMQDLERIVARKIDIHLGHYGVEAKQAEFGTGEAVPNDPAQEVFEDATTEGQQEQNDEQSATSDQV